MAASFFSALVRGGAEGRAWQPLIVPPNLIRHVAVPGGVHVKVISAKQVRTLIGIDRHQLGAVDTRQLCDLGVEVKDLLPSVAAMLQAVSQRQARAAQQNPCRSG